VEGVDYDLMGREVETFSGDYQLVETMEYDLVGSGL